jgi:hypothetical protein
MSGMPAIGMRIAIVTLINGMTNRGATASWPRFRQAEDWEAGGGRTVWLARRG